jgi:hypothetical protein
MVPAPAASPLGVFALIILLGFAGARALLLARAK